VEPALERPTADALELEAAVETAAEADAESPTPQEPIAAATPAPAPEQAPIAETVAPSEPELPPAGITADGKACNDPRIAPRAVGKIEIATGYPALFKDEQAPPAEARTIAAPRASNDPRGPRAASAMPEVADG
jgi:ribonuclease E